MFEYKNDLLVVDELICDPSLPYQYVIRIDSNYYTIDSSITPDVPINKKTIKPYNRKVDEKWRRGKDFEFVLAGMIPRNGFDVDLGRPITAEEFRELCEKNKLTDEDVSEEFDSKVGELYGKYAKSIKNIQIKVQEDKAIPLENELRNKGIEAESIAPGTVNIRTDWGGYREGSGRKPTGRKLARIYVTEEEEQKLREYLEELRK
jgi:hypothetical protein